MSHSSTNVVIYATASDGRSETIVVDVGVLLDFVAAELLAVFNSHWREPGQPNLDRDQFVRNIQLPDGSIECSLNESGTVEFGLGSGDLFGDHSVRATIDLAGNPLFASIE